MFKKLAKTSGLTAAFIGTALIATPDPADAALITFDNKTADTYGTSTTVTADDGTVFQVGLTGNIGNNIIITATNSITSTGSQSITASQHGGTLTFTPTPPTPGAVFNLNSFSVARSFGMSSTTSGSIIIYTASGSAVTPFSLNQTDFSNTTLNINAVNATSFAIVIDNNGNANKGGQFDNIDFDWVVPTPPGTINITFDEVTAGSYGASVTIEGFNFNSVTGNVDILDVNGNNALTGGFNINFNQTNNEAFGIGSFDITNTGAQDDVFGLSITLDDSQVINLSLATIASGQTLTITEDMIQDALDFAEIDVTLGDNIKGVESYFELSNSYTMDNANLYNTVPEPSTAGLIVLAAASLLLGNRRRVSAGPQIPTKTGPVQVYNLG